MPKLFLPPRRELAPRKGPARRAAMVVAMLLLLVPSYEGVRLCEARWRAMGGPQRSVETPVLDALSGAVRSTADSIRTSAMRMTRNVPWNPRLAIPLACAWGLIGILFLRRC